MSYGPSRVFAATMAAAAGSFTVSTSRAWTQVYLQVPTCASTTALDLYCSSDEGTTYYQVRIPVAATSTVLPWTFIVQASAMAGGAMVNIPGGLTHYKFIATDAAPAAALTFKLICGA